MKHEVRISRSGGIKTDGFLHLHGDDAQTIYNEILALQRTPLFLTGKFLQAANGFRNVINAARYNPYGGELAEYRARIGYEPYSERQVIKAYAPFTRSGDGNQYVTLVKRNNGTFMLNNHLDSSYSSKEETHLVKIKAGSGTEKKAIVLMEKYASLLEKAKSGYDTSAVCDPRSWPPRPPIMR